MEKLGKEMIGYCGGLPLAITILGGLLAAKQIEEWEDVLRRVKSYLYEQPDLRLTKVMGLSYDDLPCHLKPCFLYLAHFPEDFEIPRKELTRMWMGEGFISQIQHRGGREDTMEDVGERYLQELVQRCMVQVGKNGSLGKIRTCRIHDLMREFCVLKAQRENFLQITNIPSTEESNAHIGKIRRLAINLESSDNYLEGIKFNKYPYLRSLLYFVPHDNNLYLKESHFKKIKLLRVLNLENCHYYCGNLPNDVGYLIHLRFLSLKNTKIEIVPSSMGNLKCLETLDLRSQEYGMKVPNVFKNMKQLRHLYLPIYYQVSEKLELSNLHYLQTLVNVIPESIHIPSSFIFNRLRSLRTTTFLNEWEWDSDVVQVVSSCPDIYKLNLHRLIKKLPKAHQFSPNLAKLTLWRTGLEEDPMATLEKLSNLKILRLLFNSFLGKNMVCSQRGFPLLQSLVLSELRYLEEWKVYEGAAPNLLHLEIRECWCLMTIPDGLSSITTLQKLEIHDMPKSFKDGLDKGGPDFYKVQHVPSLVFQQCDRE